MQHKTDSNGRFYLVASILCLLLVSPLLAASPSGMIKVRLGQGYVEGKPLWWSKQEVSLLSRDGQLISFRTSKASDFRKSSPRFSSFTPSDMRGQLFAEFGRDFDVNNTRHYLVVTPKGMKSQWANRFEDLYRSFYHYFRVRGFRLTEPQFPLVAIVFRTKSDYQNYSRSQGVRISPSYLGHYSRETNRVYLYDSTGNSGGDWSQNADTIIHEATHQTAFNTGVHSRFGGTPRWVTEGLATMFEARGVWNSSKARSQQDRYNRERLAEFKRLTPMRGPDALEGMIASNRIFKSHQSLAYAQAWALSFYLCETRPRDYSRYLQRTASRENFSEYPASERLRDFTAIFGNNFKLLDAQFLRYIAKLR